MDYIRIYLPTEISKTQIKQVFVDIFPTNIDITQSSRYLVNAQSQCQFLEEVKVKVKVKFVKTCSLKPVVHKLAAR